MMDPSRSTRARIKIEFISVAYSRDLSIFLPIGATARHAPVAITITVIVIA